MKSTATFAPAPSIPSDPAIPEGYEIKKVLRWGLNKNPDGTFNDVMIKEAACSTEQQHNVGSFQVIPLCIMKLVTLSDGTIDRIWVRDWSAVSQHVQLTHQDMMRVANVNLLDFGYPQNMNDESILAVKDKLLADGTRLNVKMHWWYNNQFDGHADPYSPAWGKGEWWEKNYKRTLPDGTVETGPAEFNYGCMAWGGRQIAVSKQTRVISVTLPAEPQGTGRHPVTMRQIYPMTRDDWGTRLEWLMPRATVANHPGSTFGDYPRGYIYSPGVFIRPGYEYYIPQNWLER